MLTITFGHSRSLRRIHRQPRCIIISLSRAPTSNHRVRAISLIHGSPSTDFSLPPRSHLTAGTPPSPLSSHIIVALLSPEDEYSHTNPDPTEPNVLQKLSLLRSVAQKVLESVASDRPSIARPAREARELLRELDDEALQGVF